MKIVFICGALEEGRDGVGDYTRRLAAELIRQGHTAAVVAIRDLHTEAPIAGAQVADGTPVPVLRIPAAWPGQERFAAARQWLEEAAPDWLSLQFVPFAFHEKGLALDLHRLLASLSAPTRRWHVMFHELWVGMDTEAPLKHKLWGKAQKQLVRTLLKALRPDVIHTQTRTYQAQLARFGYQAHYLPLFANIPVSPPAAARLEAAAHPLSFVVFGNIQPGAPLEQFAQEAARYARQSDRSISLTTVGRCGSELDRLAAAWRAQELPLEVLGEQPVEKISEVLHHASVGLSTTPFLQTEKSGTVAAMREHGLPVLCVARPWNPSGMEPLAPPPGVVCYRPGQLATFLAELPRHPFHSTVPEVSGLLLASLSAVP